MISRSSSRFFLLSCFESVRNGCLKSLGKITDAATTGPARQPLPASSQPASMSNEFEKGAMICFTFQNWQINCILAHVLFKVYTDFLIVLKYENYPFNSCSIFV